MMGSWTGRFRALRSSVAAGCGCWLVVACGADGRGPTSPDDERTFDVSSYEAEGIPMRIANEALVFPVRSGTEAAKPSKSEPGELLLAYVRVGCDIGNPNQALRGASSQVQPPIGRAIRLTGVRIRQAMNDDWIRRPELFPKTTCFTYRDAADAWHELMAPTETQISNEEATASITLDVPEATAGAIFLPTYTDVTNVSYTTRSH